MPEATFKRRDGLGFALLGGYPLLGAIKVNP